MKVICVDNFNRETRDDKPITVPGLAEPTCIIIANALNEKYGGPSSEEFFRVVGDDYVLFERDY